MVHPSDSSGQVRYGMLFFELEDASLRVGPVGSMNIQRLRIDRSFWTLRTKTFSRSIRKLHIGEIIIVLSGPELRDDSEQNVFVVLAPNGELGYIMHWTGSTEVLFSPNFHP